MKTFQTINSNPNAYVGLVGFMLSTLLRLYFLCSFADDIQENVIENSSRNCE